MRPTGSRWFVCARLDGRPEPRCANRRSNQSRMHDHLWGTG